MAMEWEFVSKKEIKNLLEDLGIQKGYTVLAQVDLSRFSGFIDGEQMVIDVLKELVGEEGRIIVPTFTKNCLDPACLQKIPYKDWDMYRKSIYGFDPKLSSCTQYSQFGNQFLKNANVIRWSHPVYSFAYWGNVKISQLDKKINFPISFTNTLKAFDHTVSVNLLIGVEPEESIMLPALAHLLDFGSIIVQRGKVHSEKRIQMKDFLHVELNEEEKNRALKYCRIEKKEFKNKNIYLLQLAK